MQDDCYLIAADGWKAETARIIERDKKGKERDKGWACDLVPKSLMIARYFAKEQTAIDALAAELETVVSKQAEIEEEHGGDEGLLSELEKINKANVSARLKKLKVESGKLRANNQPQSASSRFSDSNSHCPASGRGAGSEGQGVQKIAEPASNFQVDTEAQTEIDILEQWLELNTRESDLKKQIKDAESALDAKTYAHYGKLSEAEVKALVVDDKWLVTLDVAIHGEMDRISQQLTSRVKELTDRYDEPMPAMVAGVNELETKVASHLERMGFAWK